MSVVQERAIADRGVEVPSGVADQVERARNAFASGRTRSLAWRREQLNNLVHMLEENAPQIEAAVGKDLGKSAPEAYMTEVSSIVRDAKVASKNLRKWTRDRSVGGSLLRVGPSRAQVRREPLGTVLIIGPWNYPLRLVLMPLIGALAAGNTAVLKPSELTPTCSRLLAENLPRYLDSEAVVVVEGGVDETTELLQQRFDHIFYTGNGVVGSIIMAAAAQHLTPVTLELGGKSPVWVDESSPLRATAEKIAWAKFSNAGQTCVAPDYVLTTPDLAPRLADAVSAATARMYGDDPRASEYFARIVNERHAERLRGLLDSGRAVMGGTADVAQRYIAPTVLLDVDPSSPVMQQEIFGPILPIVTVVDAEEAVRFVVEREKPLALYVFSHDTTVQQAFLDGTSSGGIVFNSAMVHLGVSTLPFGGVGASGMGNYHGERSVITFSHERAVLHKLRGPDLTRLAHPPFSPRALKMLRRS